MTTATTETERSAAVEYGSAAAAEYLDVEETWIIRRARSGVIAHTRVGRSYRFSRDDLDAYLESQRRPANTTPAVRRPALTSVSEASRARHAARTRRRT